MCLQWQAAEAVTGRQLASKGCGQAESEMLWQVKIVYLSEADDVGVHAAEAQVADLTISIFDDLGSTLQKLYGHSLLRVTVLCQLYKT